MTVAELMDALSKMEPTARVFYETYEEARHGGDIFHDVGYARVAEVYRYGGDLKDCDEVHEWRSLASDIAEAVVVLRDW